MYEVSKITEIPPCCYTEEEVERLLAERMQSIADGTAELVSNDEVSAAASPSPRSWRNKQTSIRLCCTTWG